LYLQDPEHPGDPTKKIRAARKPSGLQNHHTRTSLDRKTIKPEASFVKASLRLSNSVQSSDCFEVDQPTVVCCDAGCECGTRADRVDPFTPGTWDTEIVEQPCFYYDPDVYPYFF